MKKQIGILLGLVFALPAYAAEVTLSGSASFVGAYTDAEDAAGNPVDYLNGTASDKVKFNTADSTVNLQISAKVTEKVDMTLMLHTAGGNKDFSTEAQWAYATYNINDDWQLRMGKYKGPFYMVSDYKDVGYAYPWARPPREVYSTNPIESISGLDLIMQKSINDINYLVEIYAGGGNHTGTVIPSTIDDDPMGMFSGAGLVKGSSIPFETYDTIGLNTSISTDIASLRLGYFETKVDAFGGMVDGEFGSFGGLGFTLDWNNLVIYSEYIVRETGPTLAMAFPDQTAYYVTMGYRNGDFMPYVTFASMEEGKDESPYTPLQDSVTLGLRTEIGDASSLTMEVTDVTTVKNPLSGTFNTTNSGYGLFSSPVEGGKVVTVSFDVIF